MEAIETRYNGYRFRSRLEARWAVFLNETGIRWDYEPQGFSVITPLGPVRYLPDFWLKYGAWAEVKGHLDMPAMKRLYSLAMSMTRCGKGNDLVILGDLPRLGSALWPVQLHFCQHDLWAVPWKLETVICSLRGCPRVSVKADQQNADMLTEGFPFGIPEWAEPGLEAARCARFEWGENG